MNRHSSNCPRSPFIPVLIAVVIIASAGRVVAQPGDGGPHGRPFITALGAVPLVTYVGPSSPRPSEFVLPSDRLVMAQLIGGGYVVNPRFRFGVISVFSEALTGLPP